MAINHPLSASNSSSLHDLPFPALAREMNGLSPVHTRALWQALYREGATNLAHHSGFLPPLRRWLHNNSPRLPIDTPKLIAETASRDGLTRKFLLRLADAQTIETVLM